jgi:DNA-binding NarL/FixJ family response regulator
MIMQSILVAEDDPVYRAFIREAIGDSCLNALDVFEAGDGGVAVRLAARHCTEYVVLDLQMPVLSGVETARQIWAREPRTRIMFWSNFADEAYVRSLSRIVPVEASYGYLLKSTTPDRLRVAIEGVFVDGQCIIDREIRGIQARAERWTDALNNAEYDMLIDISLGLTDQAIARRHRLSTRGVQSRLQKLYTKLGVNDAPVRQSNASEIVFNPRTRAICIGILRGLINSDLIARAGRTGEKTDTDH